MICTFGDLTDVIWWRELSLPVRRSSAPDGRLRRRGVGRARAGRPTTSTRARASYERAAGADVNQARGGSSSSSREAGDLVGEPADHARVKFFEKGERPLEIVTSRQWFIRTIAPRGADRARPRAAVAPAVHARALRELGQRPERRLVRQPPALLRRAVPGLVSARRQRRDPLRRSRSPRARSSCRSIRRPTCPTATHAEPARPAGRLRRRSRRDGHVGDLVADAADRRARRRGRRRRSVPKRLPDGPAPAGARHHPHLAVHDGPALAPRARLAAVEQRGDLRLGARPRPQEDVEVRRATSSRRWACSRSTAPTACATGRRAGARAPTRRSTPSR